MFWFPDKIKGFSSGIVIRECSQTRDEIFPALDCSQFFPPFIACKTDVETQFVHETRMHSLLTSFN